MDRSAGSALRQGAGRRSLKDENERSEGPQGLSWGWSGGRGSGASGPLKVGLSGSTQSWPWCHSQRMDGMGRAPPRSQSGACDISGILPVLALGAGANDTWKTEFKIKISSRKTWVSLTLDYPHLSRHDGGRGSVLPPIQVRGRMLDALPRHLHRLGYGCWIYFQHHFKPESKNSC